MMAGGMNPVSGGAGADWMVTGGICFSCDQIFASRKFLEEHVCPSASHICSCGTEFAEYADMRHHSTTHEPGHQVLDHETIRKRRNEKCREEEEKLKRLQCGEVVWKVPKSANVSTVSLPTKSLRLLAPKTSTFMPQNIMQTAVTSQVPALYPSMAKPLLPNTGHPDREMQNIFASVGAPTVDLWTLYQPVVLLRTMHSFPQAKPYTCGKCGESFMSKASLISHHSSHVTDKVSGCIGCGLLLSSKKVVPRFHVCNSPSTASKFRLITAKPLNSNKQTQTTNSLNLGAQSLQKNASLQRKGRNHRAHGITSQMLMNSAQQLKNQNLRPYLKGSHSPQINSSLQLKNQSSRGPKPHTAMFQHMKNPLQIASNKSRCILPSSPSAQYTISPSGPLSSAMQSSTTLNGFTCRVCHISFDTAHLLQRHKCPKAREFMAKHTRPGRQVVRHNMVTAVANRNLTRMNGVGKRGFQTSVNMKKTQLAPGLDKGQSSAPHSVKTGADLEDDCYIIEDVPDKPTEMIYQVTSSVPIIT